MTDDISDIEAFYDGSVEKEDVRLNQHQLEYDLTGRFLAQYLPSAGSILGNGPATGRYTVELCRRGYTVTAVDLSAALLERCRQRLAAEHLNGQVRFVVADARDLHAVPSTTFDAVLLMGPLYHLVVEKGRRTAIRQAVARLRGGGVLVSPFLSRLDILSDLMRRPEWIEQEDEVQSVLERGRRPDHWPRSGFGGYFARAGEIRPLHEALGIEMVALAGVEPAIAADDASYNTLQASHRARWLDLLFDVSANNRRGVAPSPLRRSQGRRGRQ